MLLNRFRFHLSRMKSCLYFFVYVSSNNSCFYSIRFTQPFLQELGFKYMKLEDDGEIGTSKNAQRFLNNMQCPLLILFIYVEVIHGITVS